MSDKICCILDFDGFVFRNYTNNMTFKNEFLIREIGYVRIDPDFGDFLAKSYRFDLSFFDFSHCQGAWQTINHQTRFVTGLSFKPQPGEKVYNYELIDTCIETIYEMCCQPGRNVVAFKGGTFEKNVLEERNIPNIDLGTFGCPKYEELIERNLVYSQLIDCGYHNRIQKEVQLVHCPRAEVIAFKDWLMLHCPLRTRGKGIRDPCGYTEELSLPLSSADSSSEAYSSSD